MRIDPDAIQSSRPVDRDIQLLGDEVRRLRAIIANSDPALTDEERSAIVDAADRYAEITPESAETAATLRGLLERRGSGK